MGRAKQSPVLKLRLRMGGLLHSTSHSFTGVRNDGIVARHCEYRARCSAAGRSNLQFEILATNRGLLHSFSISIAGVRNDGFVTRHCEHRAEVFLGRAKQSAVLKLRLRIGDCFTPPRIPSQVFAMTVRFTPPRFPSPPLYQFPQISPRWIHPIDRVNFFLP